MSTLAFDLSPRRRRAFRLLAATEMKIGLRRPVGVFVAVGIPLVLLVIFGSIPATTRPDAALGGISFFTLYVPSLLMFVLIAVGLGGLPQQLAAYREQGVLRRLSTTPVSPVWLLAAQLATSVILATIAIGILLGVGAIAFGLAFPPTVGGCLVALASLLLTAGATLGLGLCVAALARSPQMAGAFQIVCFYPLAFFSGLYVPIQEIHSRLITEIAKVLPTGAGFNALHASFLGHSPGVEPLLVLAGWAIGCSVAAARLFRWE
jgi:ABC-2 type transport system permease protein